MLSVDFSVEIATKVSDRLSHQLVSKSPSIVIMLRGLLTEHSDLEDKNASCSLGRPFVQRTSVACRL